MILFFIENFLLIAIQLPLWIAVWLYIYNKV